MSVLRADLVATLEEILEPGRFRDYCPNGLQVEGRNEIARLVTGVTASQALLDAAVELGADAVLVHHGYFWKGESPALVGMKRRRIATLLANDINLFAYHLPLDAHPELGNNATLAARLDLLVEDELAPGDPDVVGNVGRLREPASLEEVARRAERCLERAPLVIGDSRARIERVAWCTGGAQGFIELAVARGVDLYITGEASEQTVHVAREEGIAFLAAGHHATERYGVQALGELLAQRLGIEHHFVDVDNPV